MYHSEDTFNHLVQLVEENPEHFKKNYLFYKDKHIVVFDYNLVTPSDFGWDKEGYAFELRGSAFEVDNSGNYVRCICRPFEKFFNLHEFGYDNNENLAEAINVRYGLDMYNIEDWVQNNMLRARIMNKLDGSIISFFDLDGKLDCKSNSSLTSDYKYEALDIVRADSKLYELIDGLTKDGYTVMTEYTSAHAIRQIVVRYEDIKITVTGARRTDDGSYMNYDDLVKHFGEYYVVGLVDSVDIHNYEKEEIEGYVVEIDGFRFKLKTKWYLERHANKSNIMVPSTIWRLAITGDFDDYIPVIPDADKEPFLSAVRKYIDLFESILREGRVFYENNKHLDAKEYFEKVVCHFNGVECTGTYSSRYARLLYTKGYDVAYRTILEKLLERKSISRLGIPRDE